MKAISYLLKSEYRPIQFSKKRRRDLSFSRNFNSTKRQGENDCSKKSKVKSDSIKFSEKKLSKPLKQ